MSSHTLSSGWWLHAHIHSHLVLLGKVSWVGFVGGLLHLVLPGVLFLLDFLESFSLELLWGLEGVGI